jgi:hypothetical protein
MAYAVGIAGYILAELESLNPSDEHDPWVKYFEVGGNHNSENNIICLYFALTTLSTVGFGDYYPSTNYEACFMIVIFVGGVSIFSIFQSDLQEKWFIYETLTSENDHSEELDSFLMLLKKFNHNQPID